MKIKIAAFLTLVLWVWGGLYFYVSYVESRRGSMSDITSDSQPSNTTKELITNPSLASSLPIDSSLVDSMNRDTLKTSFSVTEVAFEPKTINTGFNLTDFNPDSEFENYAKEVRDYLAENPKKKLHIHGHTDSVGDDEVNVYISSQRANTLKNYFLELGVNELQLITIAKGETQPLGDNNTIEGRRKNRRIELIIE